MKRIICLLFVVIFALSFTACGKNFQTEKLATLEEKIQYFENKKLNDTYAYEFSVTYKSDKSTKTEENKRNYSVKGKVVIGLDGAYSIEYKGTEKEKEVYAVMGGNEKTTSKVKEEGIVLYSNKDGSNVYEGFFDINEKYKDPYEKYSYKEKTVSGANLLIYVPGYGSMYTSASLQSIWNSAKNATYFFIDGDNCTAIDSGVSHTKTVMVFEGNAIKEIIITAEGATYKKTTKIKFVDSISINAPSDKTEYNGYVAD